MGRWPILIFDKSLLEALSPDEAVCLAQFYRVNITPLFLDYGWTAAGAGRRLP